MMTVHAVDAQLKVNSTGCVRVGGSGPVPSYADFQIKGSHNYGLYYNTNDSINTGLYSSITSTQLNDFYGISSITLGNRSDASNKVVAIHGLSKSNAVTSGITIGVWGSLSSYYPYNKGVGVYGSVNSSFDNSIINGRYAGFFNGQTKIQGNLIVSGNIQGTLLGAPATSSLDHEEQSERLSSQMANAIKRLTANTYYHEVSDEMLRAINAQKVPSQQISIDYDNLTEEELMALEEAELDNEEALPELSAIEKQILIKQHYGLDADQLEEVFPDLVYENEDGSKSINYVEMVPILVQAINELSAKVEVLEGNNTAKKATARSTTKAEGMEEDLVMLSLGQNKPNPFGTTTSIEVCIPNDVQKAFIYVYDLQGKKVDQVDIIARGKQTIQVNAGNLCDGMYLYSLIADGKVVETRRMIVEK